MPKLQPLNGHILVRPLEGDELNEQQSGGKLSRGAGGTDRLSYGEVIEVTKDPAKHQGTELDPVKGIEPGAIIVYQDLAFNKVIYQGQDMGILAWDQVLGVVKGAK